MVITSELEELLENIYKNKIPPLWLKYCPQSCKNLGSWFSDLVQKFHFFDNWL